MLHHAGELSMLEISSRSRDTLSLFPKERPALHSGSTWTHLLICFFIQKRLAQSFKLLSVFKMCEYKCFLEFCKTNLHSQRTQFTGKFSFISPIALPLHWPGLFQWDLHRRILVNYVSKWLSM